ncbi:CinA family protein [Rhizobium sp. FY34]|uniref:CinA family protein n=1 Tax=Rhizobium sp. FY34 TaxID=2562309 RepID=UPI0010C1113F|nr:CinA family protein [Rhizobium sp. FY34]
MSLFSRSTEDKAARLIAACRSRGMMLATAESCTGGLIAAALTDISGSSAVVDRGFVTYSNEAKQQMIGVEASVLAKHGAVSRETALQMARGALIRSRANLAIAVTGIAGPGGGSVEKPVGLVHLAAISKDGRLMHRQMSYGELGRDGVRMATVETALDMLLELSQA